MIEPASPNEVPPGGWRWVHPETKHVITAGSFEDLVRGARLFLLNNDFPVPREFGQELLRSMDDAVQDDMHARGLPPYQLVRTTEKPTLTQMARRFAHEARSWASSGFKHVSQEVYEQRLDKCETCGFWQGESAFGYGRCGKCGCSGLKLFLATTRCPLDPPRWQSAP